MKSKYPGFCRRCQRRYDAGAEISRDESTGSWVCCAPSSAPSAPSGSMIARPAERRGRDWSRFAPSAPQREFLRLLAEEEAHIVCQAVAGSGKTTTLEFVFAHAPAERVRGAVYCAFGVEIARELSRRMPAAVQCSTLNSLGFAVVRQWLAGNGARPTVDANKVRGIARDLFPRREDRPLHGPLQQVVSLVRSNLVQGGDRAAILRLISRHGVDLNGSTRLLDRLLDAVPEVLRRCVQQAEGGLLDFDDQIWLPHVLDLPARTFPLVGVDEAQDLNPAQHSLALRLAGEKGRIVVVGDPNQAIYGFRGADVDSIENLSAILGATPRGAKTVALDVCYRCPRLVVEEAQRYVQHIQAAPGAEDGVVERLSERAYLDGLKQGDRTMVLCRTNAPLVAACFSLLRREVKAIIRGRDMVAGLVGLVERLAPASGEIGAFCAALAAYCEQESSRLADAGRDSSLAALQDKVETIEALCEGLTSTASLIERIDSIFSDEVGEGVVLSTIHRAKGLENAEVAILRPDLLPGPWARQEWEVRQERNLAYVAVTRAMRRLVWLTPGGGGGGELAEIEEDEPEVEKVGAVEAAVEAAEECCAECERRVSCRDYLADDDACETCAASVTLAEAPKAPAPEPAESEPAPETADLAKLPAWPSKGAGAFTRPTLADWQEVEQAYVAAGCRAQLLQLPGWRQWALLICAAPGRGAIVRVSTTLNVGAGAAREIGSNAIDVVRVERPDGPPQRGSKRKVLRVEGWKGRLAERVNEILREDR